MAVGRGVIRSAVQDQERSLDAIDEVDGRGGPVGFRVLLGRAAQQFP